MAKIENIFVIPKESMKNKNRLGNLRYQAENRLPQTVHRQKIQTQT